MLNSYDSADVDLVKEVENAQENPLEVGNITRYFTMGDSIISDPEWTIEPFIGLIMQYVTTGDFGTTFDYLPDNFSYKLYGTHDLWPLMLRINQCMTRSDFVGPTFKYIRADAIGEVIEIIRVGNSRAESGTMPEFKDRTIKMVYTY